VTASQGMRAEMRAEMRADSGEGDTIWRPGGGIRGRVWAAGSPGEWPDKRSPSLVISLSGTRERESARSLSRARSFGACARSLSLSISLVGLGRRTRSRVGVFTWRILELGWRSPRLRGKRGEVGGGEKDGAGGSANRWRKP
jgi:hypothetical protein